MQKENKKNKNAFRKFWDFLKEDSWSSFIVTLALAFLIIKFVFFPVLSLITGTSLPLVIVESCSMNHPGIFGGSFDNYWEQYGQWYEDKGISKEEFKEFPFSQGMKMGDIIFVYNRGEVELGDVIIFNGGSNHPIIHRVVSLEPLETKGDHNTAQLKGANNPSGVDETNIYENAVLGEAVFKIPRLGWAKLIFVKIYEIVKGVPQEDWC